ncbi:hypothetical protein Btru_009964 [Bulinus truncatus]|nr:hypothetical protein Btru_009964 [Bulinus truncatus]
MPSRDPRAYVKAVPLPIPSQKGLRIQARSDKVFNPCIPTRDDVRKWNYQRRLQQMTDQGFYAYNYLPYKGVGDPVYLDEKKMVLHALGQLQENESDSSSSSDEEIEEQPTLLPVFQASLAAAKFILRRTRKDLNTLNKEVVKGRSMIRKVQLGHGLFNMIKQERLKKKVSKDEEMRRKLELARTQWQPPKDSSSDDETDTDISDDLDRDDIADNTSEPSRSLAVSAKSVLSVKKKKKRKPVTPRPYTPMHTNLTEIKAEKEEISSSALFRQLCVLNWILDAMNIEQNLTMGSISTCWRLIEQEIGGFKYPSKKLREDKKTETDWEKFLTTTYSSRMKKESITKFSRLSRPSRFLAQPRFSIQSNISPSSSSSQVNTLGVSSEQPTDNTLPDNLQNVDNLSETEEDEALYKTSVFKFLDEYYDSLRRQAQIEEERQKALGTGEEISEQSPATQPDVGTRKHKHRDGSHSKKKKSEKHMINQPNENTKCRPSQKNMTDAVILSEKCLADLQEFHATKPSNKYISLTTDLHNKFKEVQEDKAMTLHDILDQMDRERFTKCQNKFSSLHTKSVSFHRAVEDMRRKGRQMSIRPEDVRRQSSFKGHWYSDLINSLPYDVKDLWYFRTILQKLGRYGLQEILEAS